MPAALLAHQLEEYFWHFPKWFPSLLSADLSNEDFVIINAIGLLIVIAVSVYYRFTRNPMIPVALASLFLVNAGAHLLGSIFTISYSPGSISGLLLLLPLGILIIKNYSPQLSSSQNLVAIVTGIVALIIVGLIGRSI